jgi:photosynthetic reaction center subunit H
MPIGSFTSGGFFAGLDLPLVLVIAFFLFFLGLVYHLHQENKREGYPLVSDRTDRTNGRVKVVGFPPLPAPKTFLLPHGRDPVTVPRAEDNDIPAGAIGAGSDYGLPIEPSGDPLLSGLGPAAWTAKIDEPDRSFDGGPVFRPLRWAKGFRVATGDPDPRGMVVLGCDKQPAGRVVDIWIDRSEHHARFLEIALDDAIAAGRTVDEPHPATRREPVAVLVTEEMVETETALVDVTEVDVVTAEVRDDEALVTDDDAPQSEARERATPPAAGNVLMPIEFTAVNGRARTVSTSAITAAQFANIPGRKADTIVTAREENQIRGYLGGGYLWATRSRAEPLI